MIILYLGILLFGVYKIVQFYIAREQAKSAINQRYAELELSALQSQMNPHFVFNALNSIQNLVSKGDSEAADTYISKFAFLMRQFLEGSKQKFIPLEEEISIISSYLELEKLRFEGRLQFAIKIKVSPQYLHALIPATLIQPFVENAILHGVFHKTSPGLVTIDVRERGERIEAIIEDDGVGRERAEYYKAKRKLNHISRGTQLVNEKLTLLNDQWNFDFSKSIEDIYLDGKPNGTRVKLTWNKNNNADESLSSRR